MARSFWLLGTLRVAQKLVLSTDPDIGVLRWAFGNSCPSVHLVESFTSIRLTIVVHVVDLGKSLSED